MRERARAAPPTGVVIVVSSRYSPVDLEWHDALVAAAAAAWLAQPWDAAAYRHLVEVDARRRREGPPRAGRSYTPVDVECRDHAVTAAVAAWLTEPRDTLAYRHLVEGARRRAGFMQPGLLPLTGDGEVEIFDELSEDDALRTVGEVLAEMTVTDPADASWEESRPRVTPSGSCAAFMGDRGAWSGQSPLT